MPEQHDATHSMLVVAGPKTNRSPLRDTRSAYTATASSQADRSKTKVHQLTPYDTAGPQTDRITPSRAQQATIGQAVGCPCKLQRHAIRTHRPTNRPNKGDTCDFHLRTSPGPPESSKATPVTQCPLSGQSHTGILTYRRRRADAHRRRGRYGKYGDPHLRRMRAGKE